MTDNDGLCGTYLQYINEPYPKFITFLFSPEHLLNFTNNKDNLYVTDNDGKTSLHFVATSNDTDLVYYLIKKGSEINTEDKFLKIPLHYAAENNQLEMMKFLLDSGSNKIEINNIKDLKHKVILLTC